MNFGNTKALATAPFSALLLCILLFASNCTKKARLNVPDCISATIEEIKKEPKWNPPAEVREYEYNGRRVYLFTSNCCDQYNTAYDESCNIVCSPSGGITGRGDGQCPDFNDKAKFVRVVWKDPR